ncbi:MAG: NADH-quinone oxidoreductase subunit NuoE [Nanoarchaeota archaeon]
MTLEHKKESRVHLLNILKDIQRKHKYLPESEIRKLSKKLDMPVIKIYSAATFYGMLSIEKKGKKVIRICNSPSCYLNGSLNILNEIKKMLKIDVGQTTKDKRYTLEISSCIGCCDKGPAMMVDDELITNVTKSKLKEILK